MYDARASVVVAAVAFLSLPSLTALRGAAQPVGEAALFLGLALALAASAARRL